MLLPGELIDLIGTGEGTRVELKSVLQISHTITIPLTKAATGRAGLTSNEVSTEVNTKVKLSSDRIRALLVFCRIERSRKEMQEFCGIKGTEYFRKNIIRPLLDEGLLKQTIPEKPKSSNQKYVSTENYR